MNELGKMIPTNENESSRTELFWAKSFDGEKVVNVEIRFYDMDEGRAKEIESCFEETVRKLKEIK